MQTLNPYLSPILHELDQFLNCFSQCTEHEIIKHLQDKKVQPFDDFSLCDTKDLFSAHFLCMHALYHLKKQYRHAKTFTLIIESVRIQRVELSEVISDNTTDDKDAKIALEPADPLESYYLNSQHYFETQADEINELLQSFWQKYIAQDHKQEALDTLNLPIDADAKMVKARYLQLVKIHHPDKGGSTEVFVKIRHAKEVLDKLF